MDTADKWYWMTTGPSLLVSKGRYEFIFIFTETAEVLGVAFKPPNGISIDIFEKIFDEGSAELWIEGTQTFRTPLVYISPCEMPGEVPNRIIISGGSKVKLALEIPSETEGCTLALPVKVMTV